ncbi:mitochondrial ribosomal protein L24 [Xylocopa sonorina]|uniref:mitochondrial ribosomal protein L24 n=1 Tax=Xylocopa sonorina TaxID=1818115 RepID=UPI00403AF2D9
MKPTPVLFKRMGDWSVKYSNLPERYINRITERVYWRPPPGKPQFLPRRVEANKKLFFSVHRPWTATFQLQNFVKKRRDPIVVEPIKNWSFFRGDRVEVLYGHDKGKQGIVKDIIQERNWVIVGGLNTKLVIQGKSKDYPGYCQRLEQPLLVTTQVQLVDPFDLKATSIEWRYTEKGEHVRVSCRTGRIIPVPVSANETVDYKAADVYQDQPKDTTENDVKELTFQAELKTFEMDIMDKMGIKEDRVPKEYYWY